MNSERPESNRAMARRRTGDRAIILLIIGCLLLTPPLASIFQLDWRLFGIPFTGLYLFAVWAGLIVATAILSKRLQANADWDNRPDDGESSDTETTD